jgi:hypothetical protein
VIAPFEPIPAYGVACFDVARSRYEVLAAWNLVYRVYLASGYIGENGSRLHAAPQMFSERARVFLKHVRGLPRATVSAVLDGPHGLPMDECYGPELDALRARGRRMMEVAHFADAGQLPGWEADRAAAASSLETLTGLAFQFGRAAGVDDLVIGVHPRHARFYERAWGFEQEGEPSTCSAVRHRPVTLMRLDWRAAMAQEEPPRMLKAAVLQGLDASYFEVEAWMTDSAVELEALAA